MALFCWTKITFDRRYGPTKNLSWRSPPVNRRVDGSHVTVVERAYHQSDRQCNDCAVMRSLISRRTCYHTNRPTDRVPIVVAQSPPIMNLQRFMLQCSSGSV